MLTNGFVDLFDNFDYSDIFVPSPNKNTLLSGFLDLVISELNAIMLSLIVKLPSMVQPDIIMEFST